MGKIVAIGGGEISKHETSKIDKYILMLSNKQKPKLLFVPTASNDNLPYIQLVNEYFTKLGCVVDVLDVYSTTYTDEEIRKKIFTTDIIYVGGGDTSSMMDKWRELHIDVYLKDAYQRNIVLAGLSAGAICCCLYGCSDSNSFIDLNDKSFCKVYGLNFIKVAICPHYDEEGRKAFDNMILEDDLIQGIALENNTALVEENKAYYIIKSNSNKKAFLLRKIDGKLEKTELSEYMPINL